MSAGGSGGSGTGGTPCVVGAPCSKLDWAKRFGDADEQWGFGIAFDPAGDVMVTGQFRGSIDFGDGPLTTTGDGAVFVAKLAGADGAPRWSREFGPTGTGTGIAIDAAGNVFLAGTTDAPIDFGGGPRCDEVGAPRCEMRASPSTPMHRRVS